MKQYQNLVVGLLDPLDLISLKRPRAGPTATLSAGAGSSSSSVAPDTIDVES